MSSSWEAWVQTLSAVENTQLWCALMTAKLEYNASWDRGWPDDGIQTAECLRGSCGTIWHVHSIPQFKMCVKGFGQTVHELHFKGGLYKSTMILRLNFQRLIVHSVNQSPFEFIFLQCTSGKKNGVKFCGSVPWSHRLVTGFSRLRSWTFACFQPTQYEVNFARVVSTLLSCLIMPCWLAIGLRWLFHLLYFGSLCFFLPVL